MLTKEEAKKIMEVPGEVRGAALKTDQDYILMREGKEGLKAFQKRVSDLGIDLKYESIEPTSFYKIGIDLAQLLLMEELFGFKNEDFKDLGSYEPKLSFLLKFFVRYFVSMDKLLQQSPTMWRDHYTIGGLEVVEFDKDKRKLILRLKDFSIHPVYCAVFSGYFSKITEMMTKTSKVNCVETQCTFKGSSEHIFEIDWV